MCGGHFDGQVNRRHQTDKAVASSSRSSKKLMSKLLKYHVIGGAVDGQQTAAPSSEAAAGGPVSETPAPSGPTQSEPDIFQLPPMPVNPRALPAVKPTSEEASAR